MIVDIHSNLSINADSGTDTDRKAAWQAFTSVSSVLHSALIDQGRDEGDDDIRTARSMFVESIDEGYETIREFDQGNRDEVYWTDDYDSTLLDDIEYDLENNADTIYLLGEDIGYMEGNVNNTTTNFNPYIKIVNLDSASQSRMINDYQGAHGNLSEIGTAEDLLGGVVGDIIRDNSPQSVSGEYGDSATDIVTGAGSFPMSLPYTRSFQQSRIDAADKGWMHNYDITAKVTSNNLLALSSPIAASQTIAVLKVMHEMFSVYQSTEQAERIVTGLVIENWLANQYVDNTFTIRTAGGSDVYYKLADGTYEALSGSLATLSYVGGGTDEYTVTALSDSTMVFENVSTGEYRISEMTWPDGVKVDFSYTSTTLTVGNNLGRELVITDTGADGDIDYVDDNAGRRVEYTYNGTTGYLEKAVLKAQTGAAQTAYGMGTELLWQIDQSYNGTNDEWEIEEFIPEDLVNPVVTHFVNRLGQMQESEDIESNSSYFYPSRRRGETVDIAGGVSTTFSNHQGLSYKTVNALDQETTSTYFGNGLLEMAVSPLGNAIEYEYNKYGQVTKQIIHPNDGSGGTDMDEADELVTSYSYDPDIADNLVLLSVTDAESNVTSYEYNVDGFLTKVTQPSVYNYDTSTSLAPVTEYSYTSSLTAVGGGTLKLLEIVTDPHDVETKNVYFNTGLVDETIQDAGTGGMAITTEYTYDNLGNILTVVNNRGNTTTNTYNLRRQVNDVTYPAVTAGTLVVEYDYDAAGRLELVTTNPGASEQTSETVYDAMGRTWKQVDNADNYTEYKYYPTTRKVEVIDKEGRKVHSFADALGRNIKTTVAPGTADEMVEELAYTDNGQLSWVEDGEDNRTDYTYDTYGRADKVIYPDDSRGANLNYTQVTAYDDLGRGTTIRKRDGSTIHLTYDALGRVTDRTVKTSGGTTKADYDFRFDLLGRSRYGYVDKSSVTTSITTTYDAIGRKLVETDAHGHDIEYSYNNSTGAMTIDYDDDGGTDTYTVTYAVDARGQTDTITETRNSVAKELADYDYDIFGRPDMIDYGNGKYVEPYSFNSTNGLTSIKNSIGASVVEFSYAYNDAGQISSKTVSNSTYHWTPAANVTNASPVNDLNQVTSYAGNSVTYDNNGNATGLTNSKGTLTLTWSLENHLEEVKQGATSLGKYKYDAVGRRIEKDAGGSVIKYILSGSNVMAEQNGSGTLLRRYVYGPGVDTPIMMMDGSGNREYYHYDAQGNVIATTDDSGALVSSYTYDPYGKTDDLTGNVYRYTGRRLDFETGFYYYRARYYDPDMGRYLSVDPIGYGDGLNMYAYVGGDPVNSRDPSGMDSCDGANGDGWCPTSSSSGSNWGPLGGSGSFINFGGEEGVYAIFSDNTSGDPISKIRNALNSNAWDLDYGADYSASHANTGLASWIQSGRAENETLSGAFYLNRIKKAISVTLDENSATLGGDGGEFPVLDGPDILPMSDFLVGMFNGLLDEHYSSRVEVGAGLIMLTDGSVQLVMGSELGGFGDALSYTFKRPPDATWLALAHTHVRGQGSNIPSGDDARAMHQENAPVLTRFARSITTVLHRQNGTTYLSVYGNRRIDRIKNWKSIRLAIPATP